MISTEPNMDETPEATPETESTAAPESVMQTHIDALKGELEKNKDQLLRALADTENTRKRAAREREEASKYAISSFTKDMVTVGDNLRRALDAVPPEQRIGPHMKALIEGIEATERDLEKNFAKYGIRKIDPKGELFNPNFHEVIFEASVPGKAAGEIVQVAEVGYLLHDRLLRPARVGVAKDEGQGNAKRGPSAEPGGHIDTKA